MSPLIQGLNYRSACDYLLHCVVISDHILWEASEICLMKVCAVTEIKTSFYSEAKLSCCVTLVKLRLLCAGT